MLKFYNCEKEPFKIYGVHREDDGFLRMPKSVADKVNEGVAKLNHNCSGGRVRFKSNTGTVAICADLNHIGRQGDFAFLASMGFDLYGSTKKPLHENTQEDQLSVKAAIETRYLGAFKPKAATGDHLEYTIELSEKKSQTFTIDLPLYAGISKLSIGVDEDAFLEAPDEYTITKPILYYGSSITQGELVSRPGNTYEQLVSRYFDWDFISLGFAASAKAEKPMMDYIAAQDMAVFVYDYDHNAPTVEYLAQTHEAGFKTIRKANPSLPVILMSRPKYILEKEDKERLEVIKKTYDNAIAAGDRNIYFIPGTVLMEIAKEDGSVDKIHPNDLGFYSISQALINVLREIRFNG